MNNDINGHIKIQRLLTLDNILCLILTIYCSINAICSLYTASCFQGIKKYLLFICLIITAITFTSLKFVFNKATDIHLTKGGNFKKKELLIYGSLILVACSISIAWNFPATMCSDAIGQYKQSITNQYSDIHPLFHTIIFFKIPTLIWQSHTSCAIFQCLFITFILLYFSYFCRKYFLSKTQTIALLTFILINPTFLKMATMPLKDVPFSFCILLGTLFLIEIIISNGEWLTKIRNKFLFCFVCFGIVFFRHNGIANFILMIIPLIGIHKANKYFYTIIFIVFSISKLIAAPIFNTFGIKKTWSKAEMIGVPLNHPLNTISYIYNNGGIVSERDKEIMSNINKLENWKKYYNKLSFYNIKKVQNGYNEAYVSLNYGEIVKTWLQMAYTNPILAIKSEVHITSLIWCIQKSFNFMDKKYLKVEYSGPHWISNIMDGYVQILQRTHLKSIIIDVSEGLLLILVSLCLTIRKMKRNIKAYLPFILVLSNVLVILCLITSGAPRFVYSSILCSYPLILYAIYNQTANTKVSIQNPMTTKIL